MPFNNFCRSPVTGSRNPSFAQKLPVCENFPLCKAYPLLPSIVLLVCSQENWKNVVRHNSEVSVHGGVPKVLQEMDEVGGPDTKPKFKWFISVNSQWTCVDQGLNIERLFNIWYFKNILI